MKQDTDDENTETPDSSVKKYVRKGMRDVDDTVRIATGFVLGGITAIHFNFGVLPIIVIGGLMVFGEAIYGFTSVWIEVYQMKKQDEKTSNDTD